MKSYHGSYPWLKDDPSTCCVGIARFPSGNVIIAHGRTEEEYEVALRSKHEASPDSNVDLESADQSFASFLNHCTAERLLFYFILHRKLLPEVEIDVDIFDEVVNINH
ncbi:MAG TPA: hypothetical protein VJB82_05480 [Candidatus Peribacterales bacterium]|nr:hypothetical protein [Candidatus Peribacterales bacterium]